MDGADTESKVLSAVKAAVARLPGVEEYVMVHHPAFRVGKKPFAIVGMRADDREDTLSVNLGREVQAGLLDDPRFLRTPYLGQHGWVTIVVGKLKQGEMVALVEAGWLRVAGKRLRERWNRHPG